MDETREFLQSLSLKELREMLNESGVAVVPGSDRRELEALLHEQWTKNAAAYSDARHQGASATQAVHAARSQLPASVEEQTRARAEQRQMAEDERLARQIQQEEVNAVRRMEEAQRQAHYEPRQHGLFGFMPSEERRQQQREEPRSDEGGTGGGFMGIFRDMFGGSSFEHRVTPSEVNRSRHRQSRAHEMMLGNMMGSRAAGHRDRDRGASPTGGQHPPFGGSPQPQPGAFSGEPMVAVLGPDGRPQLLPRSVFRQLLLQHLGPALEGMDLPANLDDLTYEQLLELQERLGGNHTRGATSEEMASNTEVAIFTKNRKESGEDSTMDDTCVICQDDFEEGERVRRLKGCHHVFHAPCIDRWLSTNHTCPICKRDV